MFLRLGFIVTLFIALFSLFNTSTTLADDEKDIFADYNTDMRKHADAKAENVYNAWGDNMANLIQSGYRDGVVIEGEGSYKDGKIRADGAGNVVVDKFTNVGSIVNKPKFQNTTVIFKGDSKNNSDFTRNVLGK